MIELTILKQALQDAAALSEHVVRLESDQYQDQIRSRMGNPAGSLYPYMYGELSALAGIAARSAQHALGSTIEQISGALALLERLDAALSEFNFNIASERDLRLLELLAADDRYRHDRARLMNRLDAALGDVASQEREREQEEAAAALAVAGFAHVERADFDGWERPHPNGSAERVSVDIEPRGVETFEYKWTLTRDGAEVGSGFSGSFDVLLKELGVSATEGAATA